MSSIEGQRVLVTGAGGFIGGHLVAALVRGGARVRGFLRYNSRNDHGTLGWFTPDIEGEVETISGDLRDVESVRRAARGTTIMFHLAAQIAIPYSYVNPRDFFETNVLGSLNVAQSALDASVEHLIHVSSSEVYGTARTIPITEDHPLRPQSPYAASKLGADKLIESFHLSHGLPATIVRPFNTYGPHQSSRAIVPTILSQALSSDMLRLGSMDPRRDLTYVADTVAGLIAAARHRATVGHTIQLGSGQDVSVTELVELVGDILGRQLKVEHDPDRVRPAGSEVQRLISGPALAHQLMDWEPRIALRDGLAQTMEWISANLHRYRVGDYVV
jgi:dTDP-glucose 4,6-dehydratase